MKKTIVSIVVGLVVVLVVVLVVAFFSLDSLAKSGFNNVGPKITKVDTRLSGAAISPFSGSGELSGLFIGNPTGYKGASSIEAKDIKVAIKLGSVFSDKLVVEQVHVKGPEITFEGGLSGNNLSKLLANIQETSGGGAQAQPAASGNSGQRKLQVNEFVIEGGIIHVNLTDLGGRSMTVPLPEIRLENLGSDSQGITQAELAKQIMEKLLVSVTSVVTKEMTKLGAGVTDIGKGATKQLEGATKGLKDIFK